MSEDIEAETIKQISRKTKEYNMNKIQATAMNQLSQYQRLTRPKGQNALYGKGS